jgi:hypothetical protein
VLENTSPAPDGARFEGDGKIIQARGYAKSG